MRTRVPETADPDAPRPVSAPAGRAGDTSRRPRILLLITLGEVGGAQGYVASLLPAFANDFDAAVATYGDGFLKDAAARSGVRFFPLRHVRRPIRPWRDLAGLVELIRLLRRERPDILHASSSKAGILGRFAAFAVGVPIRIFSVHGWAFGAHQGLISVLYRWADRAAARVTTTTICVSENQRVQGIRAGTCRAERTVVIRNAVDVAAAPRARHDRATPRLVTVGRLKRPKDFLTLVRALAALGPGSFEEALIVGEGPDRDAIQREIARLGLEDRVQLTGERSDVPELLAAADVFVLSSTSEGLPLSVMEAMAAGLPVVASAVGGVAELVVDGETGLLVPAGDPTELTSALERVLLDRQLRRRLGAAGRARAEDAFDVASFRSAHLEVYRRELARAGAPAP
jgi:glycosyltransferase involved in cell wall biosynthesis